MKVAIFGSKLASQKTGNPDAVRTTKTADTLKARALLVTQHCTALPYRQAPRAEMGLTG